MPDFSTNLDSDPETMPNEYRIWTLRGALIILHSFPDHRALWGSRTSQNEFNLFPAIHGHVWHCISSKTPDSESLHRAHQFAPNIRSRGLLGLDILTKIVSNYFRQCSGISGREACQKHRIRNPRIVLMILHRLSAPEAFWGSRFRPKWFQ